MAVDFKYTYQKQIIMFMRFALLASTALGLSAVGAHADNNIALLSQTGNDNAALIAQDGSYNTAGQHRNAARPDSRILQLGNANDINFSQSGSANSIGTGDLFRQSGNRNSATLEQDGVRNEFSYMVQAGNGIAAVANELVILQDGSDNRVKELRQTLSGGTATNTTQITQEGERHLAGGRIRQLGSGNALTVRQTGSDNVIAPANNVAGAYGLSGEVNSVTQSGQANSMTLMQDGANNYLRAAQQHGDSNILALSVTGNGNGRTALSAAGLALSGAESASLWQVGTGNNTALSIDGHDNAFGIAQQGHGNIAVTLITGTDNAFALGQFGHDNVTDALIDGNMNKMSLFQDGDQNRIKGKQDGSQNTATVVQNGTNNFTQFQQVGAHNSVVVSQ